MYLKVGADVLQTNQTNSRDLKKFDALSVIDITLEKRYYMAFWRQAGIIASRRK